jgi:hypothetical protein
MVILQREGLKIDRTKTIGDEKEIDGWLGFTFPGRGERYSDMKWHWHHFTGTDWVPLPMVTDVG